MERLSFESEGTYSGLEASIHIARYAVARMACRGKRVLDLACGEGYGSRLMHDWGATEVVGIDVSQEAISKAQKNFACDGVRYLCGNAELADQILLGETFDIVISLETIEHLSNPAAYLVALTRLRAPGSTLFISCPNDWWYYPNSADGNPYHIRKYSYEDFLELVTPILGAPDEMGLGFPVAGFINLTLESIVSNKQAFSQHGMMESTEHKNVLVVPAEPGSLSDRNSSYFLAKWTENGRGTSIDGAAMLPVPMDVFRNGIYSGSIDQESGLKDKLNALNFEHISIIAELADLKLAHQTAQIIKAAVSVENSVLTQNVGRLFGENLKLSQENLKLSQENVTHENALKHSELAAHRYLKIRSFIPKFLLQLGRLFRSIVRKAR